MEYRTGRNNLWINALIILSLSIKNVETALLVAKSITSQKMHSVLPMSFTVTSFSKSVDEGFTRTKASIWCMVYVCMWTPRVEREHYARLYIVRSLKFSYLTHIL